MDVNIRLTIERVIWKGGYYRAKTSCFIPSSSLCLLPFRGCGIEQHRETQDDFRLPSNLDPFHITRSMVNLIFMSITLDNQYVK